MKHAAQEDDTGQSHVDRILAVRRTAAPLVWSWVIGVLAEWGWDVTALIGDRPLTMGGVLLLLAIVIYLAAVLLGKRWPWVERIVLTSAERPVYVAPKTDPNLPG